MEWLPQSLNRNSIKNFWSNLKNRLTAYEETPNRMDFDPKCTRLLLVGLLT